MISFALVAICYSFFPAPSVGSFMGRLNAELVALWGESMGDGQAEGDSRQDEAWGCQSSPPWKPILICILLPVSFFPLGLSPYFLQRILILSPICICHLTSYSASHSFCSGHSIALIVALALRRPDGRAHALPTWPPPCISAALSTGLVTPSWAPISITLPYPFFMGSLLFFPTAVAGGGCRCGHETWAATAPQVTSSSLSSATCTPMGARALYSLQPHEDHTTYTSLQYSGPDKSP